MQTLAYLDNAATTPLDPRALDALLEVLPRAVASLRPTAGRAVGAAVPS